MLFEAFGFIIIFNSMKNLMSP
ncbi:hypothetical protein Q604_UNBC15906G0001, partial [human gut metagenome]